jgi:DNA-binding NarL/FixJ family response regulator
LARNGKPSVLIVDDDPDIRHALSLLFEFEDFHVVAEASSGAEAVPLAIQHEPDFVILDYLMPGSTGDKTAGVLRALVPQARIVAFSAVLEVKPNWADAFLNKDRIAEVAPLLTALLEAGSPPAPSEQVPS